MIDRPVNTTTVCEARPTAAQPLRDACPVCGTAAAEPFVTIPTAPVHCNVLWPSAESARNAPAGSINLAFCDGCGHIFNRTFDEALTTYGAAYENSLHHSAVFQGYARDLVAVLVERHDIRGRDIVEVGAGQGDFLQMLCAAGSNRGHGFDPSYVGAPVPDGPVTLVSAFYDERFADYPADVIVCRHVLEHIDDSGAFVAMVRRVIGQRTSTVVFFEVPNASWTIHEGGVWDVIYEHCGYFTPSSLGYVFTANGFAVDRVEPVFGGQFLTLEGRPGRAAHVVSPPALVTTDVARDIAGFAANYAETIARWSAWIDERRSAGMTGVIWGAGSKGVSFLNAIDAGGVIDRAVDINPRKHGMFVAGSGQEIVGPEALRSHRPDFALAMNPNYLGEIAANLRQLDVTCELVAV
jgi:hypothetical protein